MIIKEQMPRSFVKFSQLNLYGNVWRSVWRIFLLGLKELKKKTEKHFGTSVDREQLQLQSTPRHQQDITSCCLPAWGMQSLDEV